MCVKNDMYIFICFVTNTYNKHELVTQMVKRGILLYIVFDCCKYDTRFKCSTQNKPTMENKCMVYKTQF